MTEEKKTVLSFAQAKKAEQLFGTPCFLFDEAGIHEELKALHCAFAKQEDYCNYIPIRDVPNPVLLQRLAQAGSGFLAVGKGELMLAEKCGLHGEQLLYQPVCKDFSGAELAEKLHAAWLAVSPELLPPMPVRQVLLRCLPEKEYMKPLRYVKTAGLKDGMNFRQLTQAVQMLMARGYEEVGLELQLKPYDLHTGFYSGKTEVLFSIGMDLQKQTGVRISVCNPGDNPGHDYRKDRVPCSITEEAQRIFEMQQSLPSDFRPRVQTALGRQILQNHGTLLTKVQEIRQTEKRYLVVNASVAQCLRIAVQKTEHRISLLYGKSRKERTPFLYSVVGQQPDGFDHFAAACVLPEAQEGDYCLIHDMGCSGISMPSFYGLLSMYPACLMQENGELIQLSPGRTEQDVLEFLTAW